jgi:uncharacterized damage-inducible protein DinB
MTKGEALSLELELESKTTRKLLERVPEDAFDWKPHEKSMTLGQLASHLAENPNWVTPILEMEEMSVDEDYTPYLAASSSELLDRFDSNTEQAIEALKNQSDENLMTLWRFVAGGEVKMEMPRASVVRSVILNHSYHHRGQLSVYLRLRDVPIPSIYGPSADEGM